jgi:hypothetical protein
MWLWPVYWGGSIWLLRLVVGSFLEDLPKDLVPGVVYLDEDK